MPFLLHRQSGPPEKSPCFAAIHIAAGPGNKAARKISAEETKDRRQAQTINHFNPLFRIDSVDSSLKGNGGSGKSGNQRMAFTCWDSKIPGENRPEYNSKQRRTQSNQRLRTLTAEIDHIRNSHRNGRIDHRHYQHSHKVADSSHHNRRIYIHGAGRYTGGNGVGSIGPAIDKITHSVRNTVTNKTGFDANCWQKNVKDRSIPYIYPLS